jgi:5-bromo-4-chloroindolyl phosphate hydrolysis protein
MGSEINMVLGNIEFIKQGNKDQFLTARKRLMELGMSRKETDEILEELFWAVADEYGD